VNSQPNRNKAWHYLAVIAAVLLVGIWPVRYLASPKWNVWVTLTDGTPVQSINVQLVYQNYSTEDKDHEITLTTDAQGHVQFAAQYQRACFLQTALYTLLAARAFVHASFGRHAYVFAYADGYESTVVTAGFTDWSGNPATMQSRIAATKTAARSQ